MRFQISTLTIATCVAFVAQLLAAIHASAQSADRPNVIVILTDDQGWGDLSLHGNPNLSTPNIDSLARDGAHVESFYVCPVCSPTRAEFLTGRYHTRMGVYSTSAGGERINADEQTIGDVFKSAGYATAAYGKWHSGMQYPYHPNARGFDDYYGFCSGHWGDYFSPMLEHNGKIVQGNGFLVDDLTDHAIDFISDHKDDSFFVYLPYNTPHAPMQVPDKNWDQFKDKPITPDPQPENAKAEDADFTRAALAMCQNIDDNVGRLLKHLDETGLADDTIVVYFCDNGPNSFRFNGGLRGRKGSTHEGGVRSPLVIRYPVQIPAGTKVATVSAAIDLLPTLTDLCGVDASPKKTLDGTSIAPALRGETMSTDNRIVFASWNGRTSARNDRYRMHEYGGLHDVIADPRELNDIRKEEPEVAAEMMAALKRYVAETKPRKASNEPERAITLGHPGTIYHQMPARDAKASGGVVRSNKHPNCSFMTNWVDANGAITWDVDVLGGGEFDVTMYYAVSEGNEGSEITLTLGDESITTTIDRAHDVPLTGMENDRVPRPESYVKDWATMKLGRMTLSPGPGELVLRATKVSGTEVAEMRLLMFTRVAE